MNFLGTLGFEKIQEGMRFAAVKMAKQAGPQFLNVLNRNWTSHFVDLCDVFYECGYKMLKVQTLPDTKVYLPAQKGEKEMEVDAEGLRVFLLDVLHLYVGEHVAKTSSESFFHHYRRLKKEKSCESKIDRLTLSLDREMGALHHLDERRKEAEADKEAQEEAERILLINMENTIDAYGKNKKESFVVCLVQCLISETLLTFYSAAYNRAYQRFLEKENLLIN